MLSTRMWNLVLLLPDMRFVFEAYPLPKTKMVYNRSVRVLLFILSMCLMASVHSSTLTVRGVRRGYGCSVIKSNTGYGGGRAGHSPYAAVFWLLTLLQNLQGFP